MKIFRTILTALALLASACATSVTGQIASPNGIPIVGGTVTWTLSQAAVVQGTTSYAAMPFACYTTAMGNVVGLPDPIARQNASGNYSSGTLGSGTYYVEFSWWNASGETLPGPELSFTMTGTGTLVLSLGSIQVPASATGYKTYIGATSGSETLQSTTTGFGSYSQTSSLSAGASPQTSNGSVCSVQGNDTLTPSYTYYNTNFATASGSTVPGWPQQFYINGSTLNIANLIPCTTCTVQFPQPILQNTTSGAPQSINTAVNFNGHNILNATFLNPVFTNLTVNAAFTLNGIQTVNGSINVGPEMLNSITGTSGSHNFTGVVKAVNAGPSTISTIVQAVVMANAFTFTGGAAGWYAAPYYSASGGFAVDTWYAFHACQNTCFTNAQIKAFADKLVTYKDGSGHLPIAVELNNTPIYYAGGDMLHNYVTGDGAFFTPQIYNLYLTLSGDVAGATANLAALNTALGLIPLDGTTHLVNVPNGTPWVPWGFHDGEQGTGNDLMGSLEFYAAQTAMAALYAAAGQSANAAAAAAAAAAVKASLQAASALWDSSDGMYYANTIQNNQIDILGSAFAAYLGVASSTQKAAIANYLYSNYLTFTLRGYVRQSPITWQYAWGSQPAQGYDNGYWSVGDEWVINTLSLVSTVAANRLASDFIGGSDPTMEWWGSGSGTFAANYAHGATSNMESPMGVMASGIVGTTFADTPATIADLIPGSLSDSGGNFFGPSLSVAGAGYFGFCPAALAGVTCTPDTVMSRDSADVFDFGNAAQDTTAAVQFGIARAANGSYSAPSYTFLNCANCGMFFDSGNAGLGLTYGGVQYVLLNASGLNSVIPVQAPSYRFTGAKFSASGCSNSTLLGGATGGSYVSGTSGTCTVTVTMGGSQSATNGWTCTVHDLTTPADTQAQEGPVSTTQVTFSGMTVSGDVIVFGCAAY